MGVFKDDTPSTVADRALREVGAKFHTATEQRAKARQLAQVVEVQINEKIATLTDDMKRQEKEKRKVEFQMSQLEREKRLH